MATAAVPAYDASARQSYRYGVSPTALAAPGGSASYATYAGERTMLIMDKLPAFDDGTPVRVKEAGFYVISSTTCDRVQLEIVSVVAGQDPHTEGVVKTRLANEQLNTGNVTSNQVVSKSGLATEFTWLSANDYYYGVSLHSAVANGNLGCYRTTYATGLAAFNRMMRYNGDGLADIPATFTSAGSYNGAGLQLVGYIIVETPDGTVLTITTGSAVAVIYKVWMPITDAGGEFPAIGFTGLKTAGTTPVLAEFKRLADACDALATTMSFRVTTDGESSEVGLGDPTNGIDSVALPADTDAGDYFDAILSLDVENRAVEALVRDQTGRGTAISTVDTQWLCHGKLGIASGGVPYGYVLDAGELFEYANFISITGGAGSYHGEIAVGSGLLGYLSDSMMAASHYLGPALKTAFTRPRMVVDASIGGNKLTADTAGESGSTAAVTRFVGTATINHLQYLKGVKPWCLCIGFNDINAGGLTANTARQAMLAAILRDTATLVRTILLAGNDVVLLTPFWGAVYQAAHPSDTWLWTPRLARLLTDFAREIRCVGLNLYAIVNPASSIYLSAVDDIHPSETGGPLLAAKIAAAYEAGYVPWTETSNNQRPGQSRPGG